MGGMFALLVFVALVCLSFGGGQPQQQEPRSWRSVLAVVVGAAIGLIIACMVNPVR